MVCSILICMLHFSRALHKINKISQKANWKGQPDRWTGPGIDKGDTLTKEIIANLIVNLWGGVGCHKNWRIFGGGIKKVT